MLSVIKNLQRNLNFSMSTCVLCFAVFVTLYSYSEAADCRKCSIAEKSNQIDCSNRQSHSYICRDDGDCLRKGLDCCCLNLCGGTQCIKFTDEDDSSKQVNQPHPPALPRARLGVRPTEPPSNDPYEEKYENRERFYGDSDRFLENRHGSTDRFSDRDRASSSLTWSERMYLPDDEYTIRRRHAYFGASSSLRHFITASSLLVIAAVTIINQFRT